MNLVPKGDLWSTPGDWATVLPGLLGNVESSALDSLIGCEGSWTYSIGRGRGQLQIGVEHGVTGAAAEQEILLLRLVARGDVNDQADLEAGYSIGHEAIVKTFRDISGEPALRLWGLDHG